MNRLTSKIENDNYCMDFYKDEYQTKTRVINKLGQLEDIEEKLDIDLIPLLTALSNGYVFWKYDDFIYKVEVESITNCCLKVNTWYYVNSNKNGKRYGDEFAISFKDYGKTWALTREKLENDINLN